MRFHFGCRTPQLDNGQVWKHGDFDLARQFCERDGFCEAGRAAMIVYARDLG